MKYYVENQGDISLGQKEFLASGGEKSVYFRGTTAYAIYHEASKMISTGKIKELSALTMPEIFRPEALIYDDARQKIVGHTMRFVPDTESLCKCFTKGF